MEAEKYHQGHGQPENHQPGHEPEELHLQRAGADLLHLEGGHHPLGYVEEDQEDSDLSAGSLLEQTQGQYLQGMRYW